MIEKVHVHGPESQSLFHGMQEDKKFEVQIAIPGLEAEDVQVTALVLGHTPSETEEGV